MAAQNVADVVKQVDSAGPIQKAKLRSPFSKIVTIVIVSTILIASRAAHTVLCQPFKKAKTGLSVYITLVEAISFPISMLIWVVMSYYSQGCLRIQNWRYRMSMYALMGFLDAINSYFSAFGATKLNIAVYTVLKASSIVFSVTFSKLFTEKQFTLWHYLAVAIMFSASFFSFLDGKNDLDKQIDKASGTAMEYIWSGLASLASAASLGMLGVTTYKFVRHEKQKSEMLCIAENNAFQALFMFIFVLPMLALPEVAVWPEQWGLITNMYSLSALIWISIGLFIARPIMLFSSIAATSFASAAMTRALGAPRRLIVVIIVYFLFGDEVSDKKKLSMAFMCISLMIYAYGGSVLQKMKKRALSDNTMVFVQVEKDSSTPVEKPC